MPAEKKGAKRKILLGYTGIWPREALEAPELRKEVEAKLGQPGVYVLYRDEVPFYVGQAAKTLWRRLYSHAMNPVDTYYFLWNFFSAFKVPGNHIDEAEAMLIGAVPAANSSKPKIEPIKLSRPARNALKAIRLRRTGLSKEQLPGALKADEEAADEGEDDTAE